MKIIIYVSDLFAAISAGVAGLMLNYVINILLQLFELNVLSTRVETIVSILIDRTFTSTYF